ncbi:hypothetical protein ACLS0R_12280 [Comamonas jiangduensis]|uniref:hypothetical protein n=1 Tax=Comamonas jiangduensis TaxID=1194168 RepID=UPI003BF85DAE
MTCKVSFGWNRSLRANKEAIIAVSRAVAYGYNTREKILKVLPQFAPHRLVLAIDALVSSNMAQVNMGILSVHKDMTMVEVITKPTNTGFVIDMGIEELKKSSVMRQLYMEMGADNTAGVESLVYAQISEV